jgi:hypothetical protein
MPDASNRLLSEHSGFEDLIRAAADHHGLLPVLVLRDYWATRVLRAVATDPAQQGKVLFKGGTSLSKGWHVINRFSEDIDLLLTGPDFGPMPTRPGERKQHFKALQARIEAETPLRLPDLTRMTGREEAFFYFRGDMNFNLRYPLPGETPVPQGLATDSLFIESGYRGGPHPHVRRPLRSLVAEFLDSQPAARATLATCRADLEPFDMDLLKPERTFAEKLLALHIDMVQGVDGARRVRTRHYYDVAQLFAQSEDVRACLQSGGLRSLVREAAVVSNTYWGTSLDPDTLDLRESPALSPSPEQIGVLTASYESANERALYFRDWIPFSEILARMAQLRDELARGGWR